jgi:hypothetical protein
MKHPIKLLIYKLGKTKGDWVRYHLAEKMLLDDYSPIQTEAQLCSYMFHKYGQGRFKIDAFQKGRKGLWIFWIGYLYPNGFVRDISKNKEIDRLQKALARAKSYEEQEEIREEMQFEREIATIDKSGKRGMRILERSKAGIIHPYPDLEGY